MSAPDTSPSLLTTIKDRLPAPVLMFLRIVRLFFPSPRRLYFRFVLKNSIFVDRSEIWMASLTPEKTMQKVIDLFRPASVLDLGCGIGKGVDFFSARGIRAVGVDGSAMLISEAKNPQLLREYNLEQELDLQEKFDLIWSHEFVEHIHPRYIDNLMKTFSNHADHVVLTAARPGQLGEGHFNNQPAEYWVKQFARCGFHCDREKTEILRSLKEEFSQNILVFTR